IKAEGVCKGMPLTSLPTWPPESKTVEEDNLSLFRLARMGEAILALHARAPQEALLSYAKSIADFLKKFQRSDGSWPFRINQKTGEVSAAYSSAGICTVAFFEGLMNATGSTA